MCDHSQAKGEWGQTMKTLKLAGVPVEQLDRLVDAAAGISPELSEVIDELVRAIRTGSDIVEIGPNTFLTPNEAAKLLGMSRTHLYKLLDRDEIDHVTVGRDRRIPFAALAAFEENRRRDRRELGERFSQQRTTRVGAIEEVAGLL